MGKNIVFTLILIVILLVALNVFQFFNKQQTVITAPQPSNNIQNSPTPSVQNVSTDWQTYSSPTLGFSLQHPKDMKIYPQQGGAVLFVKLGPTQVENTELFDGISLIFDVGDLGTNTLQQAAQQKLTEIKNEPITETVGTMEEVIVGKYAGYKFMVKDLGERTYTYLPKGDSEYLVIIDSSVDPSSLGFNQTIYQMFSTLEIT